MKEYEIAHDGREEETGLRARGLRPAQPTPGSYRAPEESRVYHHHPVSAAAIREKGREQGPSQASA